MLEEPARSMALFRRLKKTLEVRSLLSHGALMDRLHEVRIQTGGRQLVEPAPVRGDRFEDDGITAPADSDLLALENAGRTSRFTPAVTNGNITAAPCGSGFTCSRFSSRYVNVWPVKAQSSTGSSPKKPTAAIQMPPIAVNATAVPPPAGGAPAQPEQQLGLRTKSKD